MYVLERPKFLPIHYFGLYLQSTILLPIAVLENIGHYGAMILVGIEAPTLTMFSG